MDLLKKLYEVPGLPVYDLPPALVQLYDGAIGFEAPSVVANFVSSIDGVVALPSLEAAPSVISGKSQADRFVMGLLRACASAVLVGAGTVRAEPEHHWTPTHVYPQASDDYARLRKALELSPQPQLVVVTAGGELDPDIPALQDAMVLTTARGARTLRSRWHSSATVLQVGSGATVDLPQALRAVRSRGHRVVLTEGGPTVIGQLLRHRLLDELFLTISPVVVGRTASEHRPGLVDGVDLLPAGPLGCEVLSLRRHRSHLFVRYTLPNSYPEQEETS